MVDIETHMPPRNCDIELLCYPGGSTDARDPALAYSWTMTWTSAMLGRRRQPATCQQHPTFPFRPLWQQPTFKSRSNRTMIHLRII